MRSARGTGSQEAILPSAARTPWNPVPRTDLLDVPCGAFLTDAARTPWCPPVEPPARTSGTDEGHRGLGAQRHRGLGVRGILIAPQPQRQADTKCGQLIPQAPKDWPEVRRPPQNPSPQRPAGRSAGRLNPKPATRARAIASVIDRDELLPIHDCVPQEAVVRVVQVAVHGVEVVGHDRAPAGWH